MDADQLTAAQRADETSDATIRCVEEALRIVPNPREIAPRIIIDVGCAFGAIPRYLASRGHYVLGIDINVEPDTDHKLMLMRWDLTKPLPQDMSAAKRGDLVLCWEVAEHLPASAADTLCDTLASVTSPIGTLLFSAARPGQGGHGHINEQEPEYWWEKLEAKGFTWDPTLSALLAVAFKEAAPEVWWYSQNIMAFRKGGE